MKRFLIADDHSIIRLGIKTLIADYFGTSPIDEAVTESDIVAAIKKNQYNLIILDINLPGTDFLSFLSWLKTSAPSTHILVFTGYPEKIFGVRCMQSGASGFLEKKASNTEILNAIQRIVENRKYISPDLAEMMLKKGDDKVHNPFGLLSTREMEMTTLLHKGYNLPAICQILRIQYSTANTYKRRIFEKLDVDNIISLTHLMHSFNIQHN